MQSTQNTSYEVSDSVINKLHESMNNQTASIKKLKTEVEFLGGVGFIYTFCLGFVLGASTHYFFSAKQPSNFYLDALTAKTLSM